CSVQGCLYISEGPRTCIVSSRRQAVNPSSIHLRNHSVHITWSTVLTLDTKLEVEWSCSTTLYEPVLRRTYTLWVLSHLGPLTRTVAGCKRSTTLNPASLACSNLVVERVRG